MQSKFRDLMVAVAPFVGDLIQKFLQNRRNRPRAVAGDKVPWDLVVVVMDGSDRREKAEIPVAEAVRFIEARTRFDFSVTFVETQVEHDYTPYVDANDGRTKYLMLAGNVPASFIRTLPPATSYLFLYKLNGREPLQAGSAMGIEYGIEIDGQRRPWATAGTDNWWFVNDPQGGFNSWAAQILTHELINTIQGKIEAPPYNQPKLDGEGEQSSIYEASRLTKITDSTYEMLKNG